jgi:ubiquinone/menaquinone biosynthesis C-methylase UbiE
MANPNRAHPNTYFVQGYATENEVARLHIQDGMITRAMGGVLPEQQQPSRFQEILDIGCGTGGWLIELASAVPPPSLLVGIDVNKPMLVYAATQAEAQQVSDWIQWREMDALRSLDFPSETFALVNLRFGLSFVRTWDWPNLLGECQRVCKAGGVVRITDADVSVKNSSPALSQLFDLIVDAFYRAGHFFTPEGDGVISQLAPLLKRAGLQNVETRVCVQEHHTETSEWQSYFEDIKHLLRTIVPFLHKWTRVPGNYELLYQQALKDLQQPDYTSTSILLTCWGNKPLSN